MRKVKFTRSITSQTGSVFDAEFDEEFNIRKAWLNDQKIKLTPFRESLLWNAFNREHDLGEAHNSALYPADYL